ncbi:hypothetical protein [Bacillus sp. UNC438CL73TsuS30]|uniref:hypothetical protein n=1 Tax=Bacillus sp. UNC438CL73TsuS30 TaxID=1340434 RepID=UPI00047ACAF7|nr:hypothetical protein [Bacillus sp. UNC438CL73TsuS30]
MIAVIDKNVRESCLIISQRAAFSPCWRIVAFYDEQDENIETKWEYNRINLCIVQVIAFHQIYYRWEN